MKRYLVELKCWICDFVFWKSSMDIDMNLDKYCRKCIGELEIE